MGERQGFLQRRKPILFLHMLALFKHFYLMVCHVIGHKARRRRLAVWVGSIDFTRLAPVSKIATW